MYRGRLCLALFKIVLRITYCCFDIFSSNFRKGYLKKVSWTLLQYAKEQNENGFKATPIQNSKSVYLPHANTPIAHNCFQFPFKFLSKSLSVLSSFPSTSPYQLSTKSFFHPSKFISSSFTNSFTVSLQVAPTIDSHSLNKFF